MGEHNGYGGKAPPPAPRNGALAAGTEPSLEQRMRVEKARQLMVGWMKARHGIDDPTIPDVLAALIIQLEHVTAKQEEMEKRDPNAPRIILPGA